MQKNAIEQRNILRQNITYSPEDELSVHIMSKISTISSIIKGYDEIILFIEDFTKKMRDYAKYKISIWVKITDGKSVRYEKVSSEPPSSFIRNKNKNIEIAIRGEGDGTALKEIKTLPFMVGCRWCATYNKTPQELHAMGEDISSRGGYFLVDGAMKYFLAQEKIAHNMICTVAEKSKGFKTTLKIQDNKNNSVEVRLTKSERKYYIGTGAFRDKFDITKLFKQIYLFIKNPTERSEKWTSSMLNTATYNEWIKDLYVLTTGDLHEFMIFEHSNGEERPITAGNAKTLVEAETNLFPDVKIKDAYLSGIDGISRLEDYPYLVIECLFPSVVNYELKAALLMKMLAQQLFTEQGIINPSDRDNLAYKYYLTPAEVFKRDITKNGGEALLLKSQNKKYVPAKKASPEAGDVSYYEALSTDNLFETFSQITTFSTPMSEHSKTTKVRGINESHVGYKCLFQTPSGAKVGLVTNMAAHCCISTNKKTEDIYNLIKRVIAFSLFDELDSDLKKKYKSDDQIIADFGDAKSIAGEKTISVNSLPITTMSQDEIDTLKLMIKRDPKFMDVAFVAETYSIENNENFLEKNEIISYNIYCDGGRVCRPVYSVQGLKENGLQDEKVLFQFLQNNSFEDLIRKGVIEMLFALEFNSCLLAEKRNLIDYNKHTHSEINPLNIYGFTSGCAPMINHNPGGRAIHESGMAKSALMPGSSNSEILSETSSKKLQTTETPLVTTIYNDHITRYTGSGVNAIVGILITNSNIEDAFTVNQRFSKNVMIEITTTTEVKVEPEEGVIVKQGKPPIEDIKSSLYHAIDVKTGLPTIGANLKVGDAIFAMYHEMEDGIVNKTEFVDEGKEGTVTGIREIRADRTVTYRITVSYFKQIDEGDKFAFRYSQKGVTGEIVPFEKMPYVKEGKNKGLRPDLLFSPLSLSSRATPGLVLEAVLGIYASITRKAFDATAFKNDIETINAIVENLRTVHNFDPVQRFVDPKSGAEFDVMMGVVYTRILKQTSKDKQKACSQLNSSVDKRIRQPSKGGPSGAIRDGFMELNTMHAHSAAHLVHSIYRNQSDAINVYICKDCGHLNDRYSPEEQFCTKCGGTNVVKTETTYAVVMIHYQLLSAGIKINLFPKETFLK